MNIPFLNGSSISPQIISWDMWYPWPPFYAHYNNEHGLWIHIGAADTNNLNSALMAGAAAVGGLFGLSDVLTALAGVIINMLDHIIENKDGSLDIYFSQHGFQCDNAPAGDPNVWISGLWTPVSNALIAAFGSATAAITPSIQVAPKETSEHRGKLVARADADLPDKSTESTHIEKTPESHRH
jgi:hypothetical protein